MMKKKDVHGDRYCDEKGQPRWMERACCDIYEKSQGDMRDNWSLMRDLSFGPKSRMNGFETKYT